jgi:hypothetical protein
MMWAIEILPVHGEVARRRRDGGGVGTVAVASRSAKADIPLHRFAVPLPMHGEDLR